MESLKPILLLIVLSGVGYGVYVALNHAPAPEPTPSSAADGTRSGAEAGSPSASENRSGASSTKNSNSGVGLGMSGILNPMGAASNSTTSTPRRDEDRTPTDRTGAAASSLPFGIGSANLNAARADSASPGNPQTAATNPVATLDAGTSAGDRTAIQPNDAAEDRQKRYEFEAARRNAQSLLNAGKLVEALRELTPWYGHPVLQSDEQTALVELLGQLSGTVIYSRQHWLMPAYSVRSGDSLETIAAQYELPWQLLAKINGIEKPTALAPGQQLKVVRGPFHGQLDLQQQWLTLSVDGMYAGRFRVEPRGPINKPEGFYPVVKYAAESSPAMAAAGPRHISLGGDVQLLCPDEAGPGNISTGAWLGAIHVTRADMNDVFDILSERSQVKILR